MMHDLNPKNLHISGLFSFFAKSKKTCLGVFLGIIPKIRFFPKNSAPSVFYPSGNQLHEKFQKNPMSRFGENAFTY